MRRLHVRCNSRLGILADVHVKERVVRAVVIARPKHVKLAERCIRLVRNHQLAMLACGPRAVGDWSLERVEDHQLRAVIAPELARELSGWRYATLVQRGRCISAIALPAEWVDTNRIAGQLVAGLCAVAVG